MSALLASPLFAERVAGDPLVVVDVGARGELQPPWDTVSPEALRVIGFEPDREECQRLNESAGADARYVPAALWSGPGEVDVHVARTPSCSSVHPPNAPFLARYAPPHVEPRDTLTVARYPSATLDGVLDAERVRCDVIKVDTQGAEREILQGAERVLREDAFAAIVETWTVPVHAGQGLTGDIMQLAHEAGLSLFDVAVAAAWERRSAADRNLGGKRQIVGLDLLFLRDPADWPAGAPETRRIKAAAVAEAFGFPDVALELLDGERALAAIVLAAAAERTRPRRLGRLRSVLGRGPDTPFAPLHA